MKNKKEKCMKKISLGLVWIMFVFLLTACGQKESSSADSKADEAAEQTKEKSEFMQDFSDVGNDPNNLMQNMDTLAFDEEYIYYYISQGGLGGSLCRVGYDGNGNDTLVELPIQLDR